MQPYEYSLPHFQIVAFVLKSTYGAAYIVMYELVLPLFIKFVIAENVMMLLCFSALGSEQRNVHITDHLNSSLLQNV